MPFVRSARFAAAVAVFASTAAAQGSTPAVWKVGGTVDASYVSATGNSEVTTMSVGDKLAATRGNWTLRQFAAYVYGKTDGVESANQLRAGVRAEYKISSRFSGFAGVTYERNAHAGFDRRIDELLGAQWRAFAAASDSLMLDAGAVFTQQVNTDGTDHNSPSARGALAYKHVFKANTFLTQGVEYVPNLEESGAYRMNTETILVAPISARISVKVGYVLQYNSRPPATFGTTDRVFTTGLQVSF
jgi:putative salt-induced outer membrane protein